MIKKIKGIYDGNCIQLLEPISLKPDTVVEVLIPEQDEKVKEQEFLEYLKREGLLRDVKTLEQGRKIFKPGEPVPYPGEYRVVKIPRQEEKPFEPVPIRGAPLSQTIIEDRR
jgi:Uma2 family endonuclease